MLKAVLANEKCSSCRNCYVFFEKSRWEMPSVEVENAGKIRELLNDENAVRQESELYTMNSILRDNVTTGCEEYRCSALDENKGCTLPAELKPVECSMWPVRVMNDDGRIFVTLAKGCHAVDEKFTDDIKKLLSNKLLEKILGILKTNGNIIKKYEPSYLKIIDITEEVSADEQ